MRASRSATRSPRPSERVPVGGVGAATDVAAAGVEASHRGRSAGLADDEAGRQGDLRAALRWWPSMRSIEQPHGLPAHLLDRLVDRRQRRLGERRLRDVVEPDRPTRRPGTASPSERATCIVCDGREVVGGEDRGRAVVERRAAARAGSSDVSEVVLADADEVGVDARCRRRPARGGSPARAAGPTRGRAGRRGSRCGGGRGSRRCSVAVIAPARLSEWTLGRLGRAGVRVDGDDRGGVADVDDGRGDEDDPVGERAAEPGDVAPLPAGVLLAVAAAGVDDQLVVRSRIAAAAPLSSSALNGSMSATRMPITLVRRLRRLRATRLDS